MAREAVCAFSGKGMTTDSRSEVRGASVGEVRPGTLLRARAHTHGGWAKGQAIPRDSTSRRQEPHGIKSATARRAWVGVWGVCAAASAAAAWRASSSSDQPSTRSSLCAEYASLGAGDMRRYGENTGSLRAEYASLGAGGRCRAERPRAPREYEGCDYTRNRADCGGLWRGTCPLERQ